MKKLAKKKTVVCSMGNLAASGGFYIAVACPKVVAEPGTLTGSIGVITQFPKVKGLLDRWDVKMETVKSGTLKDAGNPFAEMTAEERTYWQSLIDRVYSQFVRAVAEGRGLEEAAVRRIADGRVITGEEAKELKLVDALGNFYDAVELAKSEAKLSGEPHLVYPADERSLFLEQLMGSVAGAAADAVAARIAGRLRGPGPRRLLPRALTAIRSLHSTSEANATMEQPLWAPWRMEFIRSAKPTGCIFCDFPAAPETKDRENLVVHRGAQAFTCLNRYPYNSGHVMVIPHAHVGELSALAPDAWADLQDELRRAVEVVRGSTGRRG